ncbi:radical SAM/SPASM domain-containing protein [Archaeoglobus veneficus]|uniref:radical SAM/SPASM domain-containing protein n=1 Tax=Archaeoglobus veneficus TaxID=58290 RepID=UPI00064E7381|nr:radical SAM protein [Archaeoglobus veneficus]
MKIQIEVTNRCNFRCKYCIRNYWKADLLDMDLTMFRKILDSFDEVERLILYGFGEPLIHKNIVEMLDLAKSKSEVLLTTNGSIKLDKVVDKVDHLGISIDTLIPGVLESIRKGSSWKIIRDNIEYAIKRTEVELEVVLTKDNIGEFVEFVKWAGEISADVAATNLVPYCKEMYDKVLFVELSKTPVEICEKVLGTDYNRMNELLKSVTSYSHDGINAYNELWQKVRSENYHLNLPAIIENQHRIKLAREVEKIFEEARKIAKSYQIKLDLPNVFADESKRACPYEDTIFIRSDGKITPCMEFAYTHPLYINGHKKIVNEYIIGNISSFDMEFMEMKKRLVEEFPWCGDCQFAVGCWFVEEALDCYGNSPSCSECLYSAGIARCLI